MKRTLISKTPELVGKKVTLQGWIQTKRDHGKITFIDLKDRTGIAQCVGFKMMRELTGQSVVEITGLVKARPESMVNPQLETGKIEIEVLEYQVLNKSVELPIQVDGDGKEINEEMRLRYRYLDLRRERMNKIVKMRSKLIEAYRNELAKHDFVEIETPMLTKSTKEGARDFIVPSRFQPGKFYALPQSPQQYKQLLMTAGIERYFQFARCIRDEDLRADRGFEFTQLDLEVSFISQDELMAMVEDMTKKAVKAVGGKLQQDPFPVFEYQDAIKQFGADKFDLRTPSEKEQGVLSFAWVVKFPFFKKVDKADRAEVADGKSGWTFTHNPFSAPMSEFLDDHMHSRNLDQILTAQYDLVCNGHEVGGGSIRAHQAEVLKKTFQIMGYSDQEITDSIGHMLEAFTLGTPPHGGIALGWDRLVMLLANETSLKEAIAFPMTSSGRTAVMDAPSEVEKSQLDELGLSVSQKQHLSAHDFILEKIKAEGIGYEYFVHEPTPTSKDSALLRGTQLHQAAKALVMQADKEFIVVAVPGDLRADLDAIKKYLEVKKLSMASVESVEAKTKLKVGSIPPFGSSMGLKTYVDSRLSNNDQIVFNCGRVDRSVRIKYQDYLKLEKPEVIQINS